MNEWMNEWMNERMNEWMNIPWLGCWSESVCYFVLGTHPPILVLEVTKKADSAAKSALELPHAKVGVPYTDFKHWISQYILSTWQDDWNGAVANKLHYVKPVRL